MLSAMGRLKNEFGWTISSRRQITREIFYEVVRPLLESYDSLNLAIAKYDKIMGTGHTEVEYLNETGPYYWREMAEILKARKIIEDRIRSEGQE